MLQSIWKNDAKTIDFPQLEGDVKTDVLIIGGGLCGILCAYLLEQAGVDYVLAEGCKIAGGVTENTTAKITSQHGLIYDKLIKSFGKEKAKMYLLANQWAVKTYGDLCREFECEFEKKSAYTYSLYDRGKIEAEVLAVNSLGISASFSETKELPFQTAGAICFPEQSQFNPLMLIRQISKGLKIFENTFIRELTPHYAACDHGRIKANKIIVTTHFPFINKHGSYFLKLYQHRSYVVALENAPLIQNMYVDAEQNGLSFRSYQDYLLLGGGSHRTGKQGGAWGELEQFVKKYYKDATIKQQWATQDCMSLDGIPYIGQYSAITPDLFVATGFNKWGMTSSMVGAKILTDMVLGRENKFAAVFSPQRSILKPQLLVNLVETGIHLFMPTPKRCPHLGCALQWNQAEHSWDCPCHGSRFTEEGELLNNPATGDLKNK